LEIDCFSSFGKYCIKRNGKKDHIKVFRSLYQLLFETNVKENEGFLLYVNYKNKA